MKVFISWSGERSHTLANALHEWMPLVLHYVKTWLSQSDIEAGQRWADQVAKELDESNFGVLCITRENAGSPWVLFEAGALAKSMQDSRVIPLLFDLDFRDITGPLAQFQAKKADREGLWEVIQSLNQKAPQPVPEDRMKQLFDATWTTVIEQKIAAIPAASTPTKHTRHQAEILEELVSSVRTLDSRLREVPEFQRRSARHRWRRFHPMMFHELSHMLGSERGDPIGLLVIASMFRDDMPWMYELGMEAYRAAKNGTPEQARDARRRFQMAAEVMHHGPFDPEELGIDPQMLRMMMRELDHFLDIPPEAVPDTKPSDPSTPKPRKSSIRRLT